MNIVHPGVTRTEHVESWFAEMTREEGITVDAIIKREAADPAAIRRMLEAEIPGARESTPRNRGMEEIRGS